MIKNNFKILLVKVSTMGLYVSDLMKSIDSLYDRLIKLENPCGEGGEYETIVVNCPLYDKEIKFEYKIYIESEDKLAPVAYIIN